MIFYDLKEEAKDKTISNVVSRDAEIGRVARTIHRQYDNNVIVSGASGIGKSSLLEGFAYRLGLGEIPGLDDSYKVAKLDAAEIKRIAVSNEGLAQIASGLYSIPTKTIILIDDFQLISDSGLGTLEQIFEQAFFKRTDISLVLGISESGYQKLSTDDPNFLKNFEHIPLNENDQKQTLQILQALSPAFAQEYNLQIPQNILSEVVEMSRKLPSEKKQPLRAIHFLDESLAHTKVSGDQALTANHVHYVFSEKTGIPDNSLSQNSKEFLRNLEDTLSASIIGQSRAVTVVSDVIKRSRMGLRNPNRPYGSFLFLGTSGVGKTELAKSLAKIVYGSERSFTRIDMSEFGESHTVQRLVGAPPGYVGYESGGQLTNSVQDKPYSLILLDEIEKAHAKVFDIFLQVFDDGRLTDGRGQTSNFTNSIIIATSNLGIGEILKGFRDGIDLNSPEFISNSLMPALLKSFRPEFLNRFDAIIVFNPLSADDLLQIAKLEISKIEERVAEHGVKFNIDDNILREKIIELSNPMLGARPIKRFIEQTCEQLIAMKIMNS